MGAPATDSWHRAGAFLSALGVVTAVAFSDGGYFRDRWVWTVLALCALAGVALLLRERIELGRIELLALGGLASFVAWAALSATWSSLPSDSLRDAERGLIYVAALLAFLLLMEREHVEALLAGIAVAVSIVAAYGLGERLIAEGVVERDPVEGLLLVEPLGYANALGILAAIGTLLCLSLAAHQSTSGLCALAATAPPLLLTTLALTESRGAWLALGAGLSVSILVDPLRERLLATALVLSFPATLAVVLAERSTAFADETATISQVAAAERRIAVAVVVLGLLSGLASAGVPWVASRLSHLRASTMVIATLGTVVLAVGIGAAIRAEPLGLRTKYWRVAWHEFEQNVWLGSGSGTFAEYWQRSGVATGVRDAHSLYLEGLAELGPLGLLLLIVALGVPLLAALRGRGYPLTAAGTGAYVAFLVHAGLDWDWEMPAVTLAGLLCAVALLVGARPSRGVIAIVALGRVAPALAATSIAVLAVAARLLVE